jgi:transcriptional regulator with XRE-family HTH domain
MRISKKVSQEDILKIVSLIEGNVNSTEIIKMFNITTYRFYKIMNEYNVKPAIFKKGPKKPTGPKKTQFKLLLEGTEEEQKQAKIFPEEFIVEHFIADSKKGMKILELMSKYNLTLYQIRELRKKYDLKRR